MIFKEYSNEERSKALDILVNIYYKITDSSGKYLVEETNILVVVEKSMYGDINKKKFNCGNNGEIVTYVAEVIADAVVLKFSNLYDFLSIPDDKKYKNKEYDIIIKKGEIIVLNKENNDFLSKYNKIYTIGIKDIKYGEFLET